MRFVLYDSCNVWSTGLINFVGVEIQLSELRVIFDGFLQFFKIFAVEGAAIKCERS